MRFDEIGIFWQDMPQDRKRGGVARVMPPIPETGWKHPKEFPRLGDAKVLALDVETYDPELLTHGPGWGRNKGHIVGVSIGADSDGRWYFPVRHEVEPEDNMNPDAVFAWLRDSLGDKYQPKVGANLLYDLGWLQEEGIDVSGELFDVQFAEALLTETGDVNLDHLAKKYLDEAKTTDLLYRWCSDYYGGPISDKQRKNIYRTPPRLAGPYAEGDVDLPLRIIPRQFAELRRQRLDHLFKRENKLIPLLIAMRRQGVRIDLDKAEQVSKKLGLEIDKQKKSLSELAGRTVDVYASKSIARAFDHLGLKYNRTEKGNPSFTKAFLKAHKHPVAKTIVKIKELEKIKNVFIKAYLLESSVNGYVHCQFHPLRGEDFGTRSGRFSSSNPNLQNIPSRDKVFGPLIRGLFVPDIGHEKWRKQDASQIEYRFLAHFAVGEGSDAIREAYNRDASTDYHALTQSLIAAQTGLEIDRKPTKNINFGFIYGMGKKTLCEYLSISRNKGEQLFDAYHRGAPFARATLDYFSNMARDFGYVTTITGRRSRFDLFEPIDWRGMDKRPPAFTYEKALRIYGPNIQRAFTHKALNRVLQGSAADLMKEAMLQCYERGIFEETGVPRLTVHDELDFSDPGGKEKAFAEVKRIFENALKISVPVMVDEETGPDWGHVKEVA